MKKNVLLAFVLVLLSTAVVGRFIIPVEAGGPIYIRADGSIEGTTDIMTVDNVTYTLTDNIFNQSIIVERDDIVVDGAGYTIQGTGTGTGIYLSYRSNVTIKNMEIKAFSKGIWLYRSSNNTISRNNITANNECGILLEQISNNNTIFENNITNNFNAVVITDSYRNIIIRNTLSNNGGCIGLVISQYNTISDNNMTNNNYGIMLGYHSHYNSVFGNAITANNGSGIVLRYSYSNTIYRNNITSHGYGIQLQESFGNKFYNNNFIDNTQQVYDESWDNPLGSPSINDWDNGAEGNCWSDYEDKYPDAEEIDGSDIWDTPYVIDENNQDNYPIVPEFPTWTSILLILTVLTVAIVIYKRKLLKTLIH